MAGLDDIVLVTCGSFLVVHTAVSTFSAYMDRKTIEGYEKPFKKRLREKISDSKTIMYSTLITAAFLGSGYAINW